MTNIPKKLNIDLEDGDSVEGAIYTLEAKINELIDYLQAKEDKSYKAASSVCCDSSFRLEGDTKEGIMFNVCNNCNKACDTKLTEKKVEASKGEWPDMKCSCGEMIKDGYACSKCREINMGNRKIVTVDLTPPEHEEEWESEWERIFGSAVSDVMDGDWNIEIKKFIRDNFVSKSKLAKYVQEGIDECNEPGKHIGGVAVLREMQMAFRLEEL